MIDTKGDKRERARRRARYAPRRSDPSRFIGHRHKQPVRVNGLPIIRFRKVKGK